MTSLHADPTTKPEEPRTPEPRLRVVYRDASGTIDFHWPVERIREVIDKPEGTLWLDIEDLESHCNKKVEALLREVFEFHPLAIEDALVDTHIPKVDDWDRYLYMVFHSIDFDPATDHVRTHEIDVFLGRNYLVTYHNEPLPILEQLRRNIERDPVNRLRHGADHLLYHVLDLAVADYLPAIEHLDEAIDDAQEEVFAHPTPLTLQAIFRVKRSALKLHRVLSPEREVLNRLARDSYEPINPDHRVYFRDVYDHIVRIHDLTESLRDLISGALDTYLSAISNRTNDIMKVLTVVTVLFMPISFLVGFFGMNFFDQSLAVRNPLSPGWLFFGSCVIMVVTPALMWMWARRKGWL
jgi:magnesium transporter